MTSAGEFGGDQSVFDVPRLSSVFDGVATEAPVVDAAHQQQTEVDEELSTQLTEMIKYVKSIEPRCIDEKKELADPRDVFDALLAGDSEDYVELHGRAFPSFTDAVMHATDVLSPSDVHLFNVPAHRYDMQFLSECDVTVGRRLSTVKILLDNAGTYVQCGRLRVCARVISLIHLLKQVVDGRWRSALGDKTTVLARLSQKYYESIDVRGVHSNALQGRFEHRDSLLYELLAMLAYPELRFDYNMRFTEALLNAEYHMLRPAVDSMSTGTLYVCLFSPFYFYDAWLPYMQHYYPRIFKTDEHCDSESEERKEYVRSTQEPRWRTLQFYRPVDEIAERQDTQEFITFLVEFFTRLLTEKFLRSFRCIQAPREYEDVVDKVFRALSVAKSRPKRHCVRPAVVLKKARAK